MIVAKYQGKWLFCKHKSRNTYEICGGHIENNETIMQGASRELYEEAGAISKNMKCLGFLANYSLSPIQYAALFFANIDILDPLPNYEMEEICLFDDFPDNITYPETYKKIRLILNKYKII